MDHSSWWLSLSSLTYYWIRRLLKWKVMLSSLHRPTRPSRSIFVTPHEELDAPPALIFFVSPPFIIAFESWWNACYTLTIPLTVLSTSQLFDISHTLSLLLCSLLSCILAWVVILRNTPSSWSVSPCCHPSSPLLLQRSVVFLFVSIHWQFTQLFQ